ncbi:hypothetical protein GJ744_000460 [Endocarpon pusillum]|uniref:Uncharacterized protein n=1 Tax=Endocarpon pusillum TaxID=364733 RepID=A0A8H7AE64_9EURO|nr:hypothetical protein GJ744_000460 [Endocarpon pusillum]
MMLMMLMMLMKLMLNLRHDASNEVATSDENDDEVSSKDIAGQLTRSKDVSAEADELDVEAEDGKRQSTSLGGLGGLMCDQMRMKKDDLRVAKMLLVMQMRLMLTSRLRVVVVMKDGKVDDGVKGCVKKNGGEKSRDLVEGERCMKMARRAILALESTGLGVEPVPWQHIRGQNGKSEERMAQLERGLSNWAPAAG